MLLPHLAGVVIERIEPGEAGVLVWARVKTADGACPSCDVRSGRVHTGMTVGWPMSLSLGNR